MNLAEIKQLDQRYYMRTFGERLPLAPVEGEGCYLFDETGKRYLDLVSGIGVNILGYNHPTITRVLIDQAKKLLHCSNLFYNEHQARLAELLVEHSIADQVFFANSGAEANEGAVKLARKYFKEKDEDRFEIITACNSFHGRTLAMVAATGQEKYQKPYESSLPAGFRHVLFNDLDAVEAAITEKTCAIMVEPVQGEGGVIPASNDYLHKLRHLADKHGILLIFDEIQTGMGRTGTLFAYEGYGVLPDILTVAKGLGSGIPVGAILARQEIAAAFKPGDHGSTFGGNPFAARAAFATLQVVIDQRLPEQARRTGKYFCEELHSLARQFPIIKEIRGRGLMIGVEFREFPANLIQNCLQEGLIVNRAGSNTLRFLPPLIIQKEEIKQAIRILTKVLTKSTERSAAK